MKIFFYIIVCVFLVIGCQKQELPTSFASIEKILSYEDFHSTHIDTLNIYLAELEQCSTLECDSLYAETCRRIGSHFYAYDKYDKARQYYGRGISKSPLPYLKSRLYFNNGLAHTEEGQFYEALGFFENSRKELALKPNEIHHIRVLIYLGRSYLNLGQLNIAKQFLEQAINQPISKKNSTYTSLLGEAYLYLSDCNRKLENFNQATLVGNHGINLLKDSLQISYGDFYTLTGCYLNVGNAWQDSMLYAGKNASNWEALGDSALLYSHIAMDLYKENGLLGGQIISMQNIGALYQRQNKFLEATNILSQAIDSLNAIDSTDLNTSITLASLYLNRGKTNMEDVQLHNAKKDFESSLSILMPGNKINIDAAALPIDKPITDISTLVYLLGDIAAFHEAQFKKNKNSIKHLQNALAVYDAMVVLSDRLKKRLLSGEDKIFLNQKLKTHLNSAFLLCINLYERLSEPIYLAKALQYSEQSKSNLLLSTIRTNSLASEISPKLLSQRRKLQEESNDIKEGLILHRHSPEKVNNLNQAWVKNIAALKELDAKADNFDGKTPFGIANKSIKEIRGHIIDEDQALLEYFYLDSTLYIFLLDKENLAVKKVSLSDTFFEDIEKFDQMLSNPSGLVAEEKAFCNTSYRIYQKLFPLFDDPLPERLIIIPDESFSSLAFEALWTKATSGGFSKIEEHGNFLLHQHAISYGYSANLLWEMNKELGKKNNKLKPLAAFAASFPNSLEKGEKILLKPVEESIPYLKPLPSEEEISRISKKINIQSFAKRKASKSNFLKSCKNSNAIHIATHGVLNDENPLFNFISFSQMDQDFNEEEILYLHELENQSFNLDLVTLSACATARGKKIKGEGNISMTRGLASAGVKSIITTLWSIKPFQTIELMPMIYEELSSDQGVTKDVALAKAKRRFARSQKGFLHPSAWASVILIGDTTPIEFEK